MKLLLEIKIDLSSRAFEGFYENTRNGYEIIEVLQTMIDIIHHDYGIHGCDIGIMKKAIKNSNGLYCGKMQIKEKEEV